MKKYLFLAILSLLFIQTNAQKVYATKNGQITFNATGEAVKIMGVNNQVDSKFVESTGQIIFATLFLIIFVLVVMILRNG